MPPAKPQAHYTSGGAAAGVSVVSHIESKPAVGYKSLMTCKQKVSLLVVAAALFGTIAACKSKPGPDRVAQLDARPTPSPEAIRQTGPGQSVADCIKQVPFLEPGEMTGMLKVWKGQPHFKNYRMVEASDFRIPEWVSHEYYASDVKRATGWSHDYGELGGAYGLVVFMVDRTSPFPNCFSVAVFIRRPSNRYDLYWIFQNTDLSQFTMGRHSGDVYLMEYGNDAKTHVCDIQYSRKLKRWACEFYT